ncbi:MAG TPA: cobalamin biosynthesis protein CobD [Clostridia bacterium]|nr:cobalamin biosynthesis protein CobD [Clostridia bacterium]
MHYLIPAAVLLDLLLGDPRGWPHPVILMGKGISLGERWVRRLFQNSLALKAGGILLVTTVVGLTYLVTWGLVRLAFQGHFYLGLLVETWLLYSALAIKDLHVHARQVAIPLTTGDLPGAREKVALIVGRDTGELDQAGVTRAVVETVAENTVDGIISPLFYAFIGGAPLALAYKAINTLDSMIGYKNCRYCDLGWAAARLDDVANYLPARLTGLLLVLVAPFTPGGIKRTWTVLRRDAGKHPSPNGGIPEAAVAGALGIRLGGLNFYDGEPSYRAEMGEALRPLEIKHIKQVLLIMYAVTFLACLLGIALRLLI